MESHPGEKVSAMYNMYGSVSGIIHLVARRPVVAAVIVLAAVSVAKVPTMPPPPPTPPPPAVVSVLTPTPEPTPYAGSHKHTFYMCEFGTAAAPTNLCKATLDSVALFLQNDTEAKLKVSGSMNHVLAVRKYFVQGESKLGIASNRVEIDAESGDSSSVVIEQIP